MFIYLCGAVLRSEINDHKNRFLSQAKSLVDTEIPGVCSKVRGLIESQSGETAITSEIERWLSGITTKLNELQEQFLTAVQNLIEKIFVDNSELSVKSPDLNKLGGESSSNGNKFVDVLEGQALHLLKSVKTEHVKKAFLGLRSMKIPGFKGRWDMTLGKWANKSIPYLQIIISIWDLWRGWKSDNEQRNQARQQVMQINRAVDELYYGLRQDINQQLNDWIRQITTETDKILDDTVSKSKNETSILLEKQSRLYDISYNIRALLGDAGGRN